MVTFLLVGTAIVLWGRNPAAAQSLPAPAGAAETHSSQPQAALQPQLGTISGTVVDPDGALVANVKLTLARPGLASKEEATTDENGHFIFADVPAGAFELTLAASGFATVERSGELQAGEALSLPTITLAVARANVDVEVTLPTEQVAEDQVKLEEQQRVLGVLPNYYVSYIRNAAPLTPRLKFQLAWKSIVNPFTFGITGAIAGIEQADNLFSGYGQGAQGYAKRYGAAYGDLVTGTLIGGAILPTLLRQDPRYFYKGTGTRKSRILYAVAMSVVLKGDNGRWQPDYSGILGGLAAGGISNLYYPPENRNGVSLTFENALIGIAGGAAGNLLQEFVVRRFTPHLPPTDPGKP